MDAGSASVLQQAQTLLQAQTVGLRQSLAAEQAAVSLLEAGTANTQAAISVPVASGGPGASVDVTA
ncbi:MAG: hypothetical protein ACPGOY_10070 [Rhodospirillaceae bacterium]